MSCQTNPCVSKRSDDIIINCSICQNMSHAKCAKLTNKTIEALNQNIGLRWSCAKCKQIVADLLNNFNTVNNGLKILKSYLILLFQN